eukprot:scaffold12273_cov122-Skeletonema_dohrnii-CCMP3373.AAC.1
MSCNNVKHRLNNFDFIIMLKRKLVLPLYHPASAPVCKCGTTHDIYGYGHHHFRCTRISKKFVHDYINTQALKPVLQQVLRTAGITDNSSLVQTEQVPHHIQQQPLLRPFDIEYQPNHTLGDSNLPPSHFAICGADITIDHCPDPPSASALDEDISLYTANAERCLQTAEKSRKFTTMGNSTVTGNTMTREDVLHTLSTNAKLLQIWEICPYGGMGPMLRRFLFGDDPIRPLSFTPNPNKPHAARMYSCKRIMVFLQTRPSEILRPLLHCAHPKNPLPQTVRPRLHQSVRHPPPAANPYPAGPTGTGVLRHSLGPSWFKFSFLY